MLDRIKSFKKIDAHSHIGVFGSWSNVSITAEELIADMDEYNVEKAVISTFPIKEEHRSSRQISGQAYRRSLGKSYGKRRSRYYKGCCKKSRL